MPADVRAAEGRGADLRAAALRRAFGEEVREYLQRHPRQLPSKYFYDALGSALFEAICLLPWYRITRAESALLERHARAMIEPLRRPLTLAELGCGSGDKLALLATRASERFQSIQLVDISPAALYAARRRVETLRAGPVVVHPATYEPGLTQLARVRREGAMLVLFLGSNLGNFDPGPAHEMLTRVRAALQPGDGLLLGTDLVKPERELLVAYDDPLQVTAAFNRNLLQRVNTELGGTFDLETWSHRAVWNADASRMEMHLVSRVEQPVRIADIDLEILFEEGEPIWTESSYKYDPRRVIEIGRAAGFGGAEQWQDEEAGFAITRFEV
jgi:dimethylhistidine N-methyltransferase